MDVIEKFDDNVLYNIPFSVYIFNKRLMSAGKIFGEEDSTEINNKVINGRAMSIGETRQDRQQMSDKPPLLGNQKIILFGEKEANYGLLSIINQQYTNPAINDRGIVAVCRGRSQDMLEYKVEDFPSSADFMEALIKHGSVYNFLPNEYTLLNIYVEGNSEGRNIVLPYLEIKDKSITLTGMAIFKGLKMVYVLPMPESKIMNLLREKKTKGILTIQESPEKYINYDTQVKRKVKCNKKDGKYEFNIDLSFQGDIIENTLYKELNKENEKEFTAFMEKKIEEMCNEFLNKMKNSYKMDLLQLGMYGAAKGGRDKGLDWDSEICNSNIKVSVKVKVGNIGIGQY